jgi:hypothetical protein
MPLGGRLRELIAIAADNPPILSQGVARLLRLSQTSSQLI